MCQNNDIMYYPLLFLVCILSVQASERIVGGKPCKVARYPYIVSIQTPNPFHRVSKYYHYCGGSLLNPTWVLSVAHCYIDKGFNITSLQAVAGITNLSQTEHNEGQISKIADIIFDKYEALKHENDISLIKLETPFKQTSTVKFVTLPNHAIFPVQLHTVFKECTAMGWGVTVPVNVIPLYQKVRKDDYPDQLMCVELPLIEFENCKKMFHKHAPDIILSNTQMCTLSESGKQDACVADSGGPLICGEVQHGITSWGLGCAQSGYPGVFTRVENYVDWIKSVAGEVQTRKVGTNTNKQSSKASKASGVLRIVKLFVIVKFLIVFCW